MSWLRNPLNQYLRLTEKTSMLRASGPDALRRSFRTKARLFFHAPFGTKIDQALLGSGDALAVTPPGPIATGLLLYFHGGGFVFGAPETHAAMVAALAKRVALRALLPRYPLAPEHPYPAALNTAEAAYKAARAQHPEVPIFIGGDSAGGALALSLLARLIRQGTELPAGVFAFSPLTDMSYSGDSIRTNADAEVVLPASRANEMADMYLSGVDPKDPEVSPLFADFTGAPPIWITVGDTEILYDDSCRIVDRMIQQSVDVTFVKERDLPHVWPIFHNLLPEARHTLDALAVWIKTQTSAKAPTR